MNSPVSLEVSPATSTPTGFFSQRFWDFISPHWHPELCGLSSFPVFPSGLSEGKCGTTCSASHCLAHPGPLAATLLWVLSCPGCMLLHCLLVWMNVSSLTPWLSDFHTNRFSVSCGYFLFLNLLLSFFGSLRRKTVSFYASIVARSLPNHIFWRAQFFNFNKK